MTIYKEEEEGDSSSLHSFILACHLPPPVTLSTEKHQEEASSRFCHCYLGDQLQLRRSRGAKAKQKLPLGQGGWYRGKSLCSPTS